MLSYIFYSAVIAAYGLYGILLYNYPSPILTAVIGAILITTYELKGS